MAHRAFFPIIAVCLLLLFPVSFACHRGREQHRRYRDRGQCQLQKIDALRPTRRLESQAGYSELWDENDEQFDCAGVATSRHTIQPKGLLLPIYASAPRLVYVVEGEGYGGVVLPGCPESFQSLERFQTRRTSRRFGREESESESERERTTSPRREGQISRQGDEHQRVHTLRKGDVIALPAGVSSWAYNNGERPLVLIVVLDTGNSANQLDRNRRFFFLAGSSPQESRMSRREEGETRRQSRRRSSSEEFRSIFSGFDTRILAESFGIDEKTAEKLQNPDERNGFIIEVENGLRVAMPRRGEQERESESERRRRGSRWNDENGLEEPFCNIRLQENIGNPSRADIFSEEAGHLTTLNSQKLPILNYLKLSVEKGHLRQNAILAPHWNTNSHSIIYAICGSARMQIVDDSGNAAFDGRLEEGEMVVVPMNFAVVKQAEDEDFHWVAFKTNEFALTSPLAGKTSVIRGLPEDVLVNAFQISREEARRLKYGRDEIALLSPRSRSEERRASQ